ncbi:MAG: cupin domain-containing protein [Treponema sp.]|nr:cupin domain-containing protein [Treponema sp.]
MVINFNEITETEIQHMNNGDGSIFAKMMMTPECKVVYRRLPPGSSIGRHIQNRTSETSFVVSGEGSQSCDGTEEHFCQGMCVFCPKGSSLTITNTGKEDLVLFSVIREK